MKKYGLVCFAFSLLVAACGQRSGVPEAQQARLASILIESRAVPANTIGVELPGEGLGTVLDRKFGLVGGYTQSTRSQIIAFKPGVTITIMNLSHVISHTFNVLSVTGFPKNPVLKMTPSGGPLQLGYASGVIMPGKSVKVTLSKAGTYFVDAHSTTLPRRRCVT